MALHGRTEGHELAVIVRRADQGDVAALVDVAVRSITITGASSYDSDQIAYWSSSFTPVTLERVVDSTSLFVVDDRGNIAGFANLIVGDSGRAQVDLLYVDPGYSGRGVGRRALRAVEEEARRQGSEGLWADASLLAAPFFEHLGYGVVERYVKTRGTVSFANTWLLKKLS